MCGNGVWTVLKKAYLEITNVCNLSCSFCHKTKRKKRFMTSEEFDKLTDKLRGKVKYLYFHLMGEPTLHPCLPEFILAAKQKGFLPVITTNGSLLGEKKDVFLNALPHKISVSLHAPSANPAFSDDAYVDNCIDFAQKAAEYGCFVSLRLWNLGSEDERENVPIVNKLKEAFPGEWEDLRRVNGKKLDERIFLEYAERFDWPDTSAEELAEDADAFCYGLRDQIGILCDGTVVPCCLDAEGVLNIGNLFVSDIDTILRSDKAKAIYDGFSRRRAVESLCRRCGYARRFSK